MLKKMKNKNKVHFLHQGLVLLWFFLSLSPREIAASSSSSPIVSLSLSALHGVISSYLKTEREREREASLRMPTHPSLSKYVCVSVWEEEESEKLKEDRSVAFRLISGSL